MIVNIAAIVIGYLIGSIPSAYIITKAMTGKDIRQVGSGNVGAVNTLREAGGKAGSAVFVADAFKGGVVVIIFHWGISIADNFILLAVLAAVIGHMWPVFLSFRGGRGMSTSLGGLVIYMLFYQYWIEMALLIGVSLIALAVTHRNYALAVIIGLITVPVSVWILGGEWYFITISAVILALVMVKVIPIAREAWARSANLGDFIRGQ